MCRWQGKQGIRLGFETQSSCHQKSKTGVSVSQQKGLMSGKTLKKKSVHNWNVYTTKNWPFSSKEVSITLAIKFSRNTQSWQHCHFWTTSNGNELETVKTQINFNANLHLSWHFEFKLKWLIPLSNLFSNFRNTKMPTLPNLYIAGKLVWETINFSHWLF